MTTRERVKRMFEHREADRIPITDSPWQGTIARWEREGMKGDWRDFFDVDKFEGISVDASPRFGHRVLEDNDEFVVYATDYGVKVRQLKGHDSTPEFLDFTITDADKWKAAKSCYDHNPDRINWDWLKKNHPLWDAEGRWIDAVFWFGFDVTHSWVSGTETVLIALLEDPEWVTDIFHTMLDTNIALFDKIWDKGYRFDGILFYDDMGYKNTQFFSMDVYRKHLKPAHKKAIEWAKNRGIPARLHACGNIVPFVPELVEMGLSALNPIEIKAGMDPIKLKETYGKQLVLHGGINAVLWDKPEEIKAEIERLVPVLKENGGYIFSSDHSIPNAVSLEDFRGIVDLAKKVGGYV